MYSPANFVNDEDVYVYPLYYETTDFYYKIDSIAWRVDIYKYISLVKGRDAESHIRSLIVKLGFIPKEE